MSSYTFDFSAESWSTVEFAWNGANGSPFPGCMFADGSVTPFDYVESELTGLSFPVTLGDNISWRVRLTGSLDGAVSGVSLVVTTNIGNSFAFKTAGDITFTDSDTGWFLVTGTIAASGTVQIIEARIGDPSMADNLTGAYFDSVFVTDTPTGMFELIQSAGGIPGAIMVTS